jgi:hypothetical protein
MQGADRDILDFSVERQRHAQFLGREEVIAAIDGRLLGPGAAHGWVLVTGQPGMGKSAILTHWLSRAEREGPVPHHFIRRGVESWDQPEAIRQSLAAQIERIHPAEADPGVGPERRFLELLTRVSKNVLVPGGKRLWLVVDGLDEAAAEPGKLLPHALPEGVMVLCGSRPTYVTKGIRRVLEEIGAQRLASPTAALPRVAGGGAS